MRLVHRNLRDRVRAIVLGATGCCTGAVACQQELPPGMGHSSHSSSDSDPVDERLSYMPLVAGAEWAYVTEDADGQLSDPREIRLEVDAQAGEGRAGFTWREATNSSIEMVEHRLERHGQRVVQTRRKLHAADTLWATDVFVAPGLTWVDDAWADDSGYAESLHYRHEVHMPGDPVAEVEWRTYEYDVRDVFEPVTVPAGTFGCLRIRRTRMVGSLRGPVLESWFARGVGIVKTFRPDEGEVRVLTAVAIPGGVVQP
ncbi:MAG: hypothetical protein V3V08_02310 [Nannocystaceae bacterium]